MRKVALFAIILYIVVCAPFLLSGCGSYHGYGAESEGSLIPQEDEFWTNNGYEFQTILHREENSNLRIILQHPVFPLPEPEILISQLGVLDDSNVVIKSAKLEHFTESGVLIEPESIETSENFHIVKYDRETVVGDLSLIHI